MKRPPIPIIITLVLLNAGYLCGIYAFFKEISETSGLKIVTLFILLFFLTVFMIGINMAALNRQAKSILFLGVSFLLLAGVSALSNGLSFSAGEIITLSLFVLMGIIFISWSLFLFKDSRQPEKIHIKCGKKHKYWLYSAIVFCTVGMSFGMFGKHAYENGMYKYYGTFYLIMISLLFTGILQFFIYYILRESEEKKINCLENTGTENP